MTENILNKLEKNKTQSHSKILTVDEYSFLKKFIINEYNKNNSLTKIAKNLKITRKIVTKYITDSGITIINKQNLLRVKDNLFNNINTEYDAYWLGFCLADGYINDVGQFELSLKSTDYLHLYKFAEYIEYTGNIVESQPVKCNNKIFYRCRLNFATQHLVSNFHKFGIVPRKSMIMDLPENIPNELFRHFVRGYFEANGFLSHRNGKKLVVSFSGCNLIITKLVNLIPGNFSLRIDPRRHKNYLIANSCSNRSKLFLNYIYSDCSIYLDRKYEKYIAVQSRNILNYEGAISEKGETPNTEINTII